MFSEISVFEKSALDELHDLQIEGEPSFVGSLIREFLSQLESNAAAVIANQQTGNLKALEESAHKLKSSSAVLGLERLAANCAAIESRARAGSLAPTEVDAFKQNTLDAQSALASYLKTLGA